MPENFERYSCQMTLPNFGEEAQKRLQKAKVLVVGAGGLGCPALQYLVATGIGTIGIADDDIVSSSNLHRQVLYMPHDIGQFKADVATKRLQQQNPSINIIPFKARVTAENVMGLVSNFDLVIEGTDNFETKCLLNDACVLSGKPLVYGAIYQYEGQVSIWNVLQQDGSYSPNYRDVFPNVTDAQVPNCREGGVIPTLAGIVGCMQANEAIKYLTQSEELLTGKLWMINVQSGNTQIIRLKKNAAQITGLPQTVQVISFEQFIQNQADFELIDVRSHKEHQQFNIGGTNFPLEELELHLHAIASILRPIVVYCAYGKRSISALKKIKQAYPEKEVFSLRDGLPKQMLNC